ncbi:hypothetical protein C2845_PM07G04910 [Panicum miliaceum]|uniref:MFS18 protein n=1 Tax=Panicum miliaceum TaxID=4540 RepID=A0A3L6SQG8_PANMI|nr:hypothetical protein C2845_PM07G04910 [Panicum miliaceum]
MARSAKMMAAVALLVLAVAAATAEARNIKTADKQDDAAVQPQTFPPFDRLGGGGMPGGSSMPGFSLPGSSGGLTPGFTLPGSGSIGSMPLFGGGSPGFSGFGGLPGSPAAGGSVPEHANKP